MLDLETKAKEKRLKWFGCQEEGTVVLGLAWRLQLVCRRFMHAVTEQEVCVRELDPEEKVRRRQLIGCG